MIAEHYRLISLNIWVPDWYSYLRSSVTTLQSASVIPSALFIFTG